MRSLHHSGSMWSAAVLSAALVAGGGAALAGPAAAATCPSPGGVGVPDAPNPAGADVVVHGHGYGHSMGLSQYGAQGAAEFGCTWSQILAAYYPTLSPAYVAVQPKVAVRLLDAAVGGYSLVTAEDGPVKWVSSQTGSSTGNDPSKPDQPKGSTWKVTVGATGGLLVSDANGVPQVGVGAGAAHLELRAYHSGFDGSQPVLSDARATGRYPGVVRIRTYTGAGQLVLDRRSRWDYTSFAASGTTSSTAALTARETMVDNAGGQAVAKYLRGLAEMPVSWLVDAQMAQVVAARTYLLGTYDSGVGGYVIRATPVDQNWLGATQEEQDAQYGGHLATAVASTTRYTPGGASTGIAQTTDGKSAVARSVLYTSSHGGWSESNSYVWGNAAVPWLTQVDDSRWDLNSGNPYSAWSVGLSWDQLAAAFGFTSVTDITVPPQGDPARTGAAVRVTGWRGGTYTTVSYDGWDAMQALRRVAGGAVRSPGFTFQVLTIGGPGAQPLMGDWDGDGKPDVGWFKDGDIALQTATGQITRYHYGTKGDVAVVGDWNGDGKDSVGVFRSGTWYLRDAQSTGPSDRVFSFGRAGDLPVAGSWSGAAPTGVGVVRGTTWFVRATAASGPADTSFSLGRPGDVPVAGDWDGNGTSGPGVRRGSTWYVAPSVRNPQATTALSFGRPDDRPVVARGTTDTPAIARATTFYWRADLLGGTATSQVRFNG